MSLVPVKSIKSPKLEISPPGWLRITIGGIVALVYAVLLFLPIPIPFLKAVFLGLYTALLLVLAKRLRDRNNLVTLQANRDGVYFQTDLKDRYFYVPWRHIGKIEKAGFPLHSHALRVEILGEYRAPLRNSGHVDYVMSQDDRTFVYTLPQWNDRNRLMERMDYFRRPAFQ